MLGDAAVEADCMLPTYGFFLGVTTDGSYREPKGALDATIDNWKAHMPKLVSAIMTEKTASFIVMILDLALLDPVEIVIILRRSSVVDCHVGP